MKVALMEWMIVLRTLRDIRKSKIPLKLGYNCFLYSPKIKNELDGGWRIRIYNDLITQYLDKISSIVKNNGLNVDDFNKDYNYLDIYQNEKYDVIDFEIENKIIL